MAVALDRTIGLSWSGHVVEIECASELTRGMTIVDRLDVAADDNNRQTWRAALASGAKADVCWTFDSARFKAMLKRALADLRHRRVPMTAAGCKKRVDNRLAREVGRPQGDWES